MADFKDTNFSTQGYFALPNGTDAQRPTPAFGMSRYNTTTKQLEFYDNRTNNWITPQNNGVVAVGGQIFDKNIDGIEYRFHVFNSPGSQTFQVQKGGGLVDYLIVSGGGGGAGSSESGGGGGAGTMVSGQTVVSNQTYSFTVGQGGAGGAQSNTPSSGNGTKGGNSVAFGITVEGGGLGGTQNQNGGNGASGGGGGGIDGSEPATVGGSPTNSNTGKAGGGVTSGSGDVGGGGGGIRSAGEDFPGGGGQTVRGGNGATNSILGYNIFFCGGGGGGTNPGGDAASIPNTGTAGGAGGGGRGGHFNIQDNGLPGWPNSGSGGGGGGYGGTGGDGADGLIIIRYKKTAENSVPGTRIPTEGLVLDMDFADAGVYDGSTTTIRAANNPSIRGTLVGTNNTVLDARNLGGYIDFDGSSTHVQLDHISRNTSFSIEVWFYSRNVSLTRQYLYTVQANPPTLATYTYQERQGMMLSQNILQSQYFNTDNGVGAITSSQTFSNNTWYHVVVTHDGTTANMYINGSRDTGATTSGTQTTKIPPVNQAFIGRRGDAQGNDYMNGYIAQVRDYNRALTATEVSNLYDGTKWRFGR